MLQAEDAVREAQIQPAWETIYGQLARKRMQLYALIMSGDSSCVSA